MSKTIEVDTKTFVRFWLVILAFVVLGFLIVTASKALLIIALALFLAIALQPLARHLAKLSPRGKYRSAFQVLSLVLVIVAIALVIAFVGPIVIEETSKFLSGLPSMVSDALDSQVIDKLGASLGISDLQGQIVSTLKDLSANLVTSISSLALNSFSAIAELFVALILIIVLAILFMTEGPAILDKFWLKIADRNDKAAKVWKRVLGKMSDVIGRFVWGQMVVAILDGVVVGIAVLLISLLFGFSAGLAIPMGLISMILYLIPMFGPVISCILISVLLFFNAPLAGLIYAVFYIVYAQVESNVVAPHIQGKGMGLPPLIVLIAVTIGAYAGGLVGVLIAIPLAGCVKVLIDEYHNIKALHSKNQS